MNQEADSGVVRQLPLKLRLQAYNEQISSNSETTKPHGTPGIAMNRRERLLSLMTCLTCLFLSGSIFAGDLVLVQQGKAHCAIHAPGENEWAGRRLADRLFQFTGVRVEVHTGELPPAEPLLLVAIGTPQSNPLVKDIVGTDSRIEELGVEGYLLQSASWRGRAVLIGSGKSLSGVNNAVSELVSWKLKLGAQSAVVADDLNETDRPGLRYRIVWTWDGHCNWAATVDETMALYVNGNPEVGSMAVPYTPDGFRSHFTRAIDYFSDHKLNGLIVWGFLRDEHGGLEMGRDISLYAKRNNVRILPGVCSQGGYSGFIFSKTNKFNLEVWCQQHPELQALNEKGESVPGMINPSKSENQQWLRDGAEWLFANLPDIGGINLENGDFMSCYCEACRAERAKPENDPNCFWDMMTSQQPILEVAKLRRPDGWMTFATYAGFTEATARNISKTAVYPPKFVQQTPDNAICQWTFTGMTTPATWPDGARPPAARFQDQIGLLHHGSLWGAPVDPARWWAAPGAWADEYSTLMPFVCGRVLQAKLGGLVITGQNGNQFPAHELNYLALEYFGWHPERTYEQFQHDRLEPCYGGAERAGVFLKLLRDTVKAPADIEAGRLQAQQMSEEKELDLRQRARWVNLAGELARRKKLAEAPAKQAETSATKVETP